MDCNKLAMSGRGIRTVGDEDRSTHLSKMEGMSGAVLELYLEQ